MAEMVMVERVEAMAVAEMVEEVMVVVVVEL